ncbi:MAG TPA: hypothetical protein VKT49_13525 [Bryobacteraceae bacterium]|nr:hypothetical protein [Bryobacteraceae bacterium]
MVNPGSIAAPADGKRSILERMLNRVFRCSHRHQTRPITLKGETFAICLDCGGHVPYSLDALQPKKPVAKAAVPQPPAGSKPPAPQPAAAPKRTGPPLKPVLPPAKPSAAPPKVPPAPAKRSNAPPPVSPVRGALRKWTREGVWLGLLAIGFAGGIYYSGWQHQAPVDPPVVHPPQPPPVTGQAAAPPQMWTVPAASQPAAEKALVPETHPAPLGPRPNQPLRLQSEGRFVLLAHEAEAALELSKDPGKLKTLIQSGALLTVPRGTAVRILEKQERVAHIAVLEGPAKGEEGWILATRLQ